MGRLKWIWVTLVPTAWLIAATMTASFQKVFSSNPAIGLLSNAAGLSAKMAGGLIPAAKIAETHRLIFNRRFDAAVTAILAIMILVLIVEALVQWHLILSRRREPVLHESPYIATRWAADFSGTAHGDD
jgi:carbon starvation protein